jgi:hypothetical protein
MAKLFCALLALVLLSDCGEGVASGLLPGPAPQEPTSPAPAPLADAGAQPVADAGAEPVADAGPTTMPMPSGCGSSAGTLLPRAGGTTPVVGALSADRSPYAGEEVRLAVVATDADTEPLAYQWTQPGPTDAALQGVFCAKADGTAQWRSPVVAADTTFTLQVEVRDGGEHRVLRTVEVRVSVPRWVTQVYPVLQRHCAPCHISASAGGLNMGNSGNAHAALVDRTASSGCSTASKRVVPSSLPHSKLYRMLTGIDCGTRMPPQQPEVPGLAATLGAWIAAGARSDF